MTRFFFLVNLRYIKREGRINRGILGVLKVCLKRNIKGNNGFTLIELLVVVLIIGILAAVAVPQYQFAVDKSIVSSYLPLIRSIRQAKSLYYLENGTWSGNLNALDIKYQTLCPVKTGTCLNELQNCKPGNVGIDAHCSNSEITLRYCIQGSSCGSGTATKNVHMVIQWYNSGKIINCVGHSTRGKKLCNWLTHS